MSAPVEIVLIYQSLLGIYGDRGNAMVLVKRLQWRGIDAKLTMVEPGAPVPILEAQPAFLPQFQRRGACGREGDAVLVGLDFARHTNLHGIATPSVYRMLLPVAAVAGQPNPQCGR